jgi:hypothetical protein
MTDRQPIVFVDTETTGLSYHKQVFDIAMIRDNPDGTTEREQFFLPVFEVDIPGHEFSEEAKQYNHFERYDLDGAIDHSQSVRRIKHMFRDRAHFVGMVPDFDANALWKLIRESDGQRAGFPWYYQLIDVDMMAYGYFINNRKHYEIEWDYLSEADRASVLRYTGLTTLPIDTNKVCEVLGVDIPSDSERHTAMGDAEWTRNIYYALLGAEPPNS